MSETDAPIACSLDGAAYRERMEEIRALFARALKGSQRDGPRLHLTFDAAARAGIEDMVRKEKACCAFLGFHLADDQGAIKLTITVPPGAADGADEIFAPFAATPAATACDCSAKPAPRLNGILTALSLGAGGITLACAAACALVAVLAAAGVGAAWVLAFEAVEEWWLPVAGFAALMLAAAWLARYRLGGSASRLRMLQAATALAIIGALWGWIESASAPV